MPPKIPSPEPASRAKEREPKDLGLSANYRQWISFEGCCSTATDLAAESKLPDEPETEREHSRALQAHRKTLQGSE